MKRSAGGLLLLAVFGAVAGGASAGLLWPPLAVYITLEDSGYPARRGAVREVRKRGRNSKQAVQSVVVLFPFSGMYGSTSEVSTPRQSKGKRGGIKAADNRSLLLWWGAVQASGKHRKTAKVSPNYYTALAKLRRVGLYRSASVGA